MAISTSKAPTISIHPHAHTEKQNRYRQLTRRRYSATRLACLNGEKRRHNVHEDVIDRDVDDLDDVANNSHYHEAYTNGLRDFDEFFLVRYGITQ